jgi:hypothetical protein
MADLSDNTNWFETDASNNKASPNGWPEGMMPSGVNDTARGDKGALKRFWDRINPVQSITPAGGVWTFTTGNVAYPTAYVDGEIYRFSANNASIGGDQFQVNALGLKPIWKRVFAGAGWTPVIASDIVSGAQPELVYADGLNGGSGVFILLNPFVPISGDGAGGISTAGNISAAGGISAAGNISAAGGISAAGLIQTNYNGSGSGGEAIYATAGGIRSDAGGTALYLPNGNIVCQTIAVAGTDEGGVGSGVAIRCTSGAVESDHFGTAFYAPNGNVVCVSLTQSSDIRIKEDIKDYRSSLSAVRRLRPVTYAHNGKGGTVRSGRRHIGLIADEVLSVMPEMVGTISKLLDPGDSVPTELKTLDTTALIFALINCCQELAARVEALEHVRD